jgi:hypothetical protein
MRDAKVDNMRTPLDVKSIDTSNEESVEDRKEDRKEMNWTLLAFVIMGVVFLFMILAISSPNSAEKETEKHEQLNNYGFAVGDTSRR